MILKFWLIGNTNKSIVKIKKCFFTKKKNNNVPYFILYLVVLGSGLFGEYKEIE